MPAALGGAPPPSPGAIYYGDIMKHPKWSPEEDQILRDLVDRPRSDAYARLPHRTIASINSRRVKLGIQFEKFRWSPEEDAILMSFAGRHRKEAMRALPHRSMYSIEGRIKKLSVAPRDRQAKRRWLREMWYDSTISTQEIARRMGINRQSVSSLASRMKLGWRPNQTRKPYERSAEMPVPANDSHQTNATSAP